MPPAATAYVPTVTSPTRAAPRRRAAAAAAASPRRPPPPPSRDPPPPRDPPPRLLLLFCAAAATAALQLYGGRDASLAASSPPANSVMRGVPRVVDGDTLAFGRDRVRLFAVDAPEARQTCDTATGPLACGAAARAALADAVARGGGRVECAPANAARPRDRYGRLVGVCVTDDARRVDVGRELVEQGWAVAYRRYGRDYVAAEQVARAEKRGIWATDFEMPEDWRRARRASK